MFSLDVVGGLRFRCYFTGFKVQALDKFDFWIGISFQSADNWFVDVLFEEIDDLYLVFFLFSGKCFVPFFSEFY